MTVLAAPDTYVDVGVVHMMPMIYNSDRSLMAASFPATLGMTIGVAFTIANDETDYSTGNFVSFRSSSGWGPGTPDEEWVLDTKTAAELGGLMPSDPATWYGWSGLGALLPGALMTPGASVRFNFGATAYAYTPPEGFGNWTQSYSYVGSCNWVPDPAGYPDDFYSPFKSFPHITDGIHAFYGSQSVARAVRKLTFPGSTLYSVKTAVNEWSNYDLITAARWAAVIYSDVAGAPGTLIAQSSTLSIGYSGVLEFEFETPLDITAGDYWVGVIAERVYYLDFFSGPNEYMPLKASFTVAENGTAYATNTGTFDDGADAAFGTPSWFDGFPPIMAKILTGASASEPCPCGPRLVTSDPCTADPLLDTDVLGNGLNGYLSLTADSLSVTGGALQDDVTTWQGYDPEESDHSYATVIADVDQMTSGAVYWEVTCVARTNPFNPESAYLANTAVGATVPGVDPPLAVWLGPLTSSGGWSSFYADFEAGDVIGIAMRINDEENIGGTGIWYSKNGVWISDAPTATGAASGYSTIVGIDQDNPGKEHINYGPVPALFPMPGDTLTINFGDGGFAYEPPTGFTTWARTTTFVGSLNTAPPVDRDLDPTEGLRFPPWVHDLTGDDTESISRAVSKFTFPAGTLIDLVMPMVTQSEEPPTAGTAGKWRGVIYADAAGVPGALVAQSEMLSDLGYTWLFSPSNFSAEGLWRFPMDVELAAGDYWIGILGETPVDAPDTDGLIPVQWQAYLANGTAYAVNAGGMATADATWGTPAYVDYRLTIQARMTLDCEGEDEDDDYEEEEPTVTPVEEVDFDWIDDGEFVEQRFDDLISQGSSGGPGFLTDVVVSDGGAEARAQRWQHSRCRYEAVDAVHSPREVSRIIAAFRATRGRYKAFRWKDWTDFSTRADQAWEPTTFATDQIIGVGDGVTTEFELIKTYTEASGYVRRILKPDEATFKVALDGEQQTGNYTLDSTTGIVTFDSAPAADVVVTWGGLFDVPARFDTDSLKVSIGDDYDIASSTFPLVECLPS